MNAIIKKIYSIINLSKMLLGLQLENGIVKSVHIQTYYGLCVDEHIKEEDLLVLKLTVVNTT